MSAATDNYTFPRPATAATRSLVDPASNPQSGTATPSDPTSPHGTLHRRKTNNYEAALADRLTAEASSSDDKPIVAAGLAYRGPSSNTAPTAAPTGPVTDDTKQQPFTGALGRQQSFNPSDAKRVHMERMLSSGADAKGGYSSVVST